MVHRQHRGSSDQSRPRALLRETHRRDHDRDQGQPRPVSVASQRSCASHRGSSEMTSLMLDGDVMRIALIVGSTRPNRFAEPTPPVFTGGFFTHPLAQLWGQTISEFDGFIICTAEYNHGPPAVLKNALDYAMKEWKHKPVTYVGYGGVGAARAIEQLRLTAIELRMAPLSLAVHIGSEAFIGVMAQGKSLDDYPYLIDARTLMFNQLVWWARALAPAHAAHILATRAMKVPQSISMNSVPSSS